MSWWNEQKHTPGQAVILAAWVGVVAYFLFGRVMAGILSIVVLANELIFQRKPKDTTPGPPDADQSNEAI